MMTTPKRQRSRFVRIRAAQSAVITRSVPSRGKEKVVWTCHPWTYNLMCRCQNAPYPVRPQSLFRLNRQPNSKLDPLSFGSLWCILEVILNVCITPSTLQSQGRHSPQRRGTCRRIVLDLVIHVLNKRRDILHHRGLAHGDVTKRKSAHLGNLSWKTPIRQELRDRA